MSEKSEIYSTSRNTTGHSHAPLMLPALMQMRVENRVSVKMEENQILRPVYNHPYVLEHRLQRYAPK